MTLTKKQRDDVLKEGYMPPGAVLIARILRPFLWLAVRIGFLRRRFKRMAGARHGAIFRHQRRGEHEMAVDLAIEAMKAFRDRKPGRFDFGHLHMNWWTFMQSAASSLRKVDDRERWDTVTAMARAGMEPFEGYDVAYAFHIFARKAFADRDYGAGVEFATLSAAADETWPDSDLLLGWYELQVGGGDALAHLRRAVRKDQSVLFRIADDPTFQRHPELIERLKETSKYGLTH